MNDYVKPYTIQCPFCGEPVDVTLDLSAGNQQYIEDCQVCCQPIEIGYETSDGDLNDVTVARAD